MGLADTIYDLVVDPNDIGAPGEEAPLDADGALVPPADAAPAVPVEPFDGTEERPATQETEEPA